MPSYDIVVNKPNDRHHAGGQKKSKEKRVDVVRSMKEAEMAAKIVSNDD